MGRQDQSYNASVVKDIPKPMRASGPGALAQIEFASLQSRLTFASDGLGSVKESIEAPSLSSL